MKTGRGGGRAIRWPPRSDRPGDARRRRGSRRTGETASPGRSGTTPDRGPSLSEQEPARLRPRSASADHRVALPAPGSQAARLAASGGGPGRGTRQPGRARRSPACARNGRGRWRRRRLRSPRAAAAASRLPARSKRTPAQTRPARRRPGSRRATRWQQNGDPDRAPGRGPPARRSAEVPPANRSTRDPSGVRPGWRAIPVTMGNFADLKVDGRFSLIFVAFNTFFALLTQEDQLRCFAGVAEHLEPQGGFVIEAFVPDLTRFDRGQRLQAMEVEME